MIKIKLAQHFVHVINNKKIEMRKLFTVILSIIVFISADVNVVAQGSDCIETDSSQKKLYLNGNNFTLIDNALRCFKLTSIGGSRDSLVRIWVLDTDFPDTPTTWRVKMFEFGKRSDIPSAQLHSLEWGYDNGDSSFPVKCIKRIRMSPEEGWLRFEKDIRSLNLPELYRKPLINNGFVTTDFGMLIIQFVFGRTTYTVDFTGLVDVTSPINALHLNYSKKITYLFWLIQKKFSIKLSTDSKGRNFLAESMIFLNLK